MATHIDEIPNEILEIIFSHIASEDRVQKLSTVCHRWKEVIDKGFVVPKTTFFISDRSEEEHQWFHQSSKRFETVHLVILKNDEQTKDRFINFVEKNRNTLKHVKISHDHHFDPSLLEIVKFVEVLRFSYRGKAEWTYPAQDPITFSKLKELLFFKDQVEKYVPLIKAPALENFNANRCKLQTVQPILKFLQENHVNLKKIWLGDEKGSTFQFIVNDEEVYMWKMFSRNTESLHYDLLELLEGTIKKQKKLTIREGAVPQKFYDVFFRESRNWTEIRALFNPDNTYFYGKSYPNLTFLECMPIQLENVPRFLRVFPNLENIESILNQVILEDDLERMYILD